jgi:hypothetical protein
MTLAQPASRTAVLYDIRARDDDFRLEIETYTTDVAPLGTAYMPYLSGVDQYYLSSGTVGPFSVAPEEIDEFLALQEAPVWFDGNLRWSTDLSVEELRSSTVQNRI